MPGVVAARHAVERVDVRERRCTIAVDDGAVVRDVVAGVPVLQENAPQRAGDLARSDVDLAGHEVALGVVGEDLGGTERIETIDVVEVVAHETVDLACVDEFAQLLRSRSVVVHRGDPPARARDTGHVVGSG